MVFFGCKHYMRECKIQCPQCKHFYTCRFCHNEKCNDHELDRYKIERVWCMRCKKEGKIGKRCEHCNNLFANYYCGKCNLFVGTPYSENYHCDGCLK